MKIEFIPKAREPDITFHHLSNGDVFKFTGEEATGDFWMKVGTTAMKLDNTKEIIPVKGSTVINYYQSHIVIQGE